MTRENRRNRIGIVGPRLGVAWGVQSVLQSHCGSLQRGRTTLANEDLPNEAPDEQRVDWISNEFEVLQGDWVQLAPYGQFPHSKGLQYFDRSDADRLVANFKSLVARLLRRFGGLPWYEGHPDTNPKDFPNKRSYGWIDELQARDDAFYAHVKWTDAGRELIASGAYKFFSPVWDAKPASVGGKSVLRPVELISVGFTNMPNLPVLPLSNEETPPDETAAPAAAGDNDMKLPPFLRTFLGFADDVTPDDEAIDNAAKAKAEEIENAKKAMPGCAIPNSILATLGFPEDATPSSEEIVAAWAEKVEAPLANAQTLANEQQSNAEQLENARRAATDAAEQATEAQRQFQAERQERIELLVANGIANGKITKAEADKWKADLAQDFDGKAVELANARPVIKTESLTANLGAQQDAIERGSTPGEQVRALANEKVRAKGVRFDVAWREVKRERPDLIAGMQQPRGRA